MRTSTGLRIAVAGCLVVAAIAVLIRSRREPAVAIGGREASARPAADSPSLEGAEHGSGRGLERSDVGQAPAPGASAQDASAKTAQPARVLRGTVLDDETGAPLERFEVIHSPAGAGRDRVDTMLGYEDSAPAPSDKFEDAHGRFEIAAGPETESLCAFAEGYERSEPVDVKPDAPNERSATGETSGEPGDMGETAKGRVAASETSSGIEIRLRRAAVVRGRVIDPGTGLPVENALVGWIDRSGETRTGPRERFERTDGLGRFSFGSLPFSARRILAGREDLGEGVSTPLALAPGEAAPEVVIELRRSGS